jgi:hypothetical protein
MVKVIADDGNFWPGFMDGKWWNTQLIQFASTRGIKVTRMTGNDSYIEFPDADLLPMSAFIGSAPDGFVIHNWPCFLSLDATKYNDPVPEGVPDRIITDDEGNETVKTWAQWGSASHVDLTDGTKGIPLFTTPHNALMSNARLFMG